MKYGGRRKARPWFVDTYRGVCNVTLPTFTSDLRRLNEAAIAFDVRRSIELGFEGTLVVSEAGTTLQEYKQFLHCVIDAAGDDLSVVVQASFDTLEDACDVLREAEQAGADTFLVGFPSTFVAQSSVDVLKYHQTLCSATELACILFTSPTFDFAHLHPSGFPLDILDDLLAIDTVAALKYEPVGAVAPALLEIHRRLNNAIPVICPFDSEAPALVTLTGQRWLGTSVYQYVGDRIPTMWRLL
ncbi:MAG: dihydrodipicolinate synthase family protein [Firmicutes bacterium]|nr:dihydrodipicolinate synthase family protein [Bacillota bacterium]